MVDHALFGSDQVHGKIVAEAAFAAKGNFMNRFSHKTDGTTIRQADQRVNGCK